jgi:hypothetical protein
LACLPGTVENRLFGSQADPQATQADQNGSTLGIGDHTYRTFALGRFNPGIYPQHRTPPVGIGVYEKSGMISIGSR